MNSNLYLTVLIEEIRKCPNLWWINSDKDAFIDEEKWKRVHKRIKLRLNDDSIQLNDIQLTVKNIRKAVFFCERMRYMGDLDELEDLRWIFNPPDQVEESEEGISDEKESLNMLMERRRIGLNVLNSLFLMLVFFLNFNGIFNVKETSSCSMFTITEWTIITCTILFCRRKLVPLEARTVGGLSSYFWETMINVMLLVTYFIVVCWFSCPWSGNTKCEDTIWPIAPEWIFLAASICIVIQQTITHSIERIQPPPTKKLLTQFLTDLLSLCPTIILTLIYFNYTYLVFTLWVLVNTFYINLTHCSLRKDERKTLNLPLEIKILNSKYAIGFVHKRPKRELDV